MSSNPIQGRRYATFTFHNQTTETVNIELRMLDKNVKKYIWVYPKKSYSSFLYFTKPVTIELESTGQNLTSCITRALCKKNSSNTITLQKQTRGEHTYIPLSIQDSSAISVIDPSS